MFTMHYNRMAPAYQAIKSKLAHGMPYICNLLFPQKKIFTPSQIETKPPTSKINLLM